MNRYQALLVAAWALAPQTAWSEPGNAKDVKGNFTLVVAGTVHYTQPLSMYNRDGTETSLVQIQPFVITGFKSFQACVGAGKELQARLNTDGYTLDFSCIGVSK